MFQLFTPGSDALCPKKVKDSETALPKGRRATVPLGMIWTYTGSVPVLFQVVPQSPSLLCPASLSTGLAGNPGLQAPAPCPNTALFPLLLMALPECGKQDFILLLSPEEKHTSARERNLNPNLEIQRDSGMAGITQEPHCQVKSYTEDHGIKEFENISYPLRAVLGLPAPHVLPQPRCLPSSSVLSFSSQSCPCSRFFISGLMSPTPKASQRLTQAPRG